MRKLKLFILSVLFLGFFAAACSFASSSRPADTVHMSVQQICDGQSFAIELTSDDILMGARHRLKFFQQGEVLSNPEFYADIEKEFSEIGEINLFQPIGCNKLEASFFMIAYYPKTKTSKLLQFSIYNKIVYLNVTEQDTEAYRVFTDFD